MYDGLFRAINYLNYLFLDNILVKNHTEMLFLL